jgi:hypothetical protein
LGHKSEHVTFGAHSGRVLRGDNDDWHVHLGQGERLQDLHATLVRYLQVKHETVGPVNRPLLEQLVTGGMRAHRVTRGRSKRTTALRTDSSSSITAIMIIRRTRNSSCVLTIEEPGN